MIFIRLKGGMGNQMFQYAFGLKLANKLNTNLKIDLSSLLDRSKGDFVYRNYDLDIFKLKGNFLNNPKLLQTIYQTKSRAVTKLIEKWVLNGKKHIKEIDFHFQEDFIATASMKNIYEGWFQSHLYFQGVEEQIRNAFQFNEAILDSSKTLLDKIKASNAICLNVRRTDFLKVDNLNTTNLNYFINAAKHMASIVDNPVFFIFSDDIKWCQENIKLEYPIEIVGHEHKGRKFGNYLQLMIACKHYIIPNSSFAWWAVWLNENLDKKVIAPKKWFNDDNFDTSDLTYDHWLRL